MSLTQGYPQRQSLAIALSKQREAKRRKMMWRGGRLDNDRQDQDLLVEEGNYRPQNTSGDPRTNDPDEMLEEQYAHGGEVKGKTPVSEITEANKDRVAAEHHKAHMSRVHHDLHGGHGEEEQGYARGGEVHEETRKTFGAEDEEDDHGDVMIMARKLKRRAARRY